MFNFNFPRNSRQTPKGHQRFQGRVPVSLYDEMERLARDAEGARYISIKSMGDADGMTLKVYGDGNQTRYCQIDVKSNLLK